jgi:hypothetical protein
MTGLFSLTTNTTTICNRGAQNSFSTSVKLKEMFTSKGIGIRPIVLLPQRSQYGGGTRLAAHRTKLGLMEHATICTENKKKVARACITVCGNFVITTQNIQKKINHTSALVWVSHESTSYDLPHTVATLSWHWVEGVATAHRPGDYPAWRRLLLKLEHHCFNVQINNTAVIILRCTIVPTYFGIHPTMDHLPQGRTLNSVAIYVCTHGGRIIS